MEYFDGLVRSPCWPWLCCRAFTCAAESPLVLSSLLLCDCFFSCFADSSSRARRPHDCAYECYLSICIVLTPSLRQVSREHSEPYRYVPLFFIRNHDRQRCGRSHDEIFSCFDFAGSYLGAPLVVKAIFVIKKIIKKTPYLRRCPLECDHISYCYIILNLIKDRFVFDAISSLL